MSFVQRKIPLHRTLATLAETTPLARFGSSVWIPNMVSQNAAHNNAAAERTDGRSFVGRSGFWFSSRRSGPLARYDVEAVLV